MIAEPLKTSIIIPVLNRAELVKRTLSSILKQDVAPSEVIVVDNGSTDNTVQSVERWIQNNSPLPFKITIITEYEPGAAAARNAGARIALGDILMFFDSDDTMRRDYVSTITGTYATHPQAEMVYWKRIIHNCEGNKSFSPRWNSTPSLETQIYHSIFSTLCVAMRKELFIRAGGWNKNLRCWDDLELGVRLMLNVKNHCGIVSINRVLVDVYSQAASITGTDFCTRKGEWEKALDTIRTSAHLVPDYSREKFLRIINLKETVLAANYHREHHGGNEEFKKIISKPEIKKYERILLKAAYAYAKLFRRGTFAIFGGLFQ